MTVPVVDPDATATLAPAWLDRRLVVAHDSGSQFVCPRCGPVGELRFIADHWSHLTAVERLLFRGQLAIVGEGAEVANVVEWLDHLGFSLGERDALRLITTQEFALDTDAWDIATTAETERRRLERLAARAASTATPRDELVTLSAHPAPFVNGPALATLTALRERRTAGGSNVAVPPRWLKSDMLKQQGRSIRIVCKRCRQSFAPLVRNLELHLGHLSAVDRILLLGQVEAEFAKDPRGLLARELSPLRDWIVRTACAPASREAAVSEVLAFLPRETVPASMSNLELRRLAVKAESVRFALARDMRQAQTFPESLMRPGEPNARLLEHPVDFVRLTAQRRLADYQAQLAALELGDRDDSFAPDVVIEAHDEPINMTVLPAGESLADPGEQPAPARLTRVESVADAIGASIEGTRSPIGSGDVWLLRDARPYVGGVIIAVDYGEAVPTAGDVRRVIECVDVEGAVRGLVIGGSFTSDVESLAWRRPVTLIIAAEASPTAEQSAPAANAYQPAIDAATESPTLERPGPDREPAGRETRVAPGEKVTREDPAAADLPEPEPEPSTPLADRLLDSARFQEQRAAVGRHAPDADFIRRIIWAAEDFQGSVPWSSFVAALGTSDAGARMRLPVLRRLLNVDGYDVVDPAEAEGLVRVDLALLRAQFGLR